MAMDHKQKMREIIRQAMDVKGLNMAEVSAHLGRAKSYMHQFFDRGVPAYLKEKDRKKISILLSLEETLLMEPDSIKIALQHRKNDDVKKDSTLQSKVVRVSDDFRYGADTIPILGIANGSGEAVMLNFNESVGEIGRHPNQIGMNKSFALYAHGDSMDNRYRSGDLVYVIAHKPPHRGQDCIVELLNGESYLKEFTQTTDKEIICRQLNPVKIWKRPISDVKAIHSVVGRG